VVLVGLLVVLVELLAGDSADGVVLHAGKDTQWLLVLLLLLVLLWPPLLQLTNGRATAPDSGEGGSRGGLGAPASCKHRLLSAQLAGTCECSLFGGSRRNPPNRATLRAGTTMRRV
jgi:hypothetical protein